MYCHTDSNFSRSTYFPREIELIKKLDYYIPKEETLFNLNDSDPRRESMKTFKNKLQFKSIDLKVTNRINSTFEYYNKFDNITYENQLESQLKKLNAKTKNSKANLLENINEFQKLQEASNELEICIDALKNKKSMILNSPIILPSNKKRTKKEEEELIFVLNSKREQEIYEIQEKIGRYKEHVDLIIDEKKELHTMNKELEDEIKNYSHEFKYIRNKLLLHYHKLLNDGKDTRSQGLSWIIKKIFELDSEVLLTHFPKFLDDHSKNFLFEYAHLDLKLEKVNERIDKVKDKIRTKNNRKYKTKINLKPNLRKNSVISNQAIEEINKLSIDRTKSILIPLSSNNLKFNNIFEREQIMNMIENFDNNALYESEVNYKAISDFFNKKGEINQNTLENVNLIKELENEESELKSKISSLKRNEMERIFKEYLFHDYERRFNTKKQVIISALIGEENTIKELGRQSRERRKYLEKIKKCKTYNYL